MNSNIIMNPNRVHEIREITKQTMENSNGDLDFADKISKRCDLNDIEKILAGCYIREFLKID